MDKELNVLSLIIFNDERELNDFLLQYPNIKLYDKCDHIGWEMKEQDGKVVMQNADVVLGRFEIGNEKVLVSNFKQYLELSDDAKKIVKSIKSINSEDLFEITLDGFYNDILITAKLYCEIFNFINKSGFKWARTGFDGTEKIQICMPDGIVVNS